MQGQSVEWATELIREDFVDYPVPGHRQFTFKLRTDHSDLKVRFRTGWYVVHMALIHYIQECGLQLGLYFIDDVGFYSHCQTIR